MSDPRVERLAAVLVDYSAAVQPGDLVLIESSTLAAPLIRAVHRRVLEAGGQPETRIAVDGVAEALLRRGTVEQLDWVAPSRYLDYENVDVRIALVADSNTRALTGVDPERQARFGRARQRLRDIVLDRAAAGELRWTVTLYPTQATAQEAEMSLTEYEDFVYRAGKLDEEDVVGAWSTFADRLAGLASWLGGKSELRVVAEGTDLRLGVEGRTWISCGGKENFPDGEVFTGPVETSLEGEITFSFPGVHAGRSIEGVRLAFQNGEVVEASARRGQEFLEVMLAMDEGARRAGEFAFGMNESIQEFTRNTLFDEKIGGTVHLALGRSYPESGGENRSALHWDLVCDLRSGGEVYVDGELVYRDGSFHDGIY